MGLAHIFQFHKAECLFGDCTAYNILFHGREVIREEGGELDCQVGCAPEDCGAQGFVEEGDGSTLVLLSNLNMDSPHNLMLR